MATSILHAVQCPNGATRYARFPLVIRDSAIHGQGVFACQDIGQAAKICEWVDGERMTYQEVKARYRDANGHIDWRYVYRRRPWMLQTVNKQWQHRNINNWVNDGLHGQPSHSAKSNVHHRSGWLVATQNIAAGEELRLDYGRKYWQSA